MLIDGFRQSVSQMYIKLKSFQESRVKKQTTSSLADRFKFRVRQKDRAKSLKMINTWNKRLERFVSRLSQAPIVQKGGGTFSTSLFGQIRQLLDHLYTTLSEHWTLRVSQRTTRQVALASQVGEGGNCSLRLHSGTHLRPALLYSSHMARRQSSASGPEVRPPWAVKVLTSYSV